MPYKWGIWWTYGWWWLPAAPALLTGRCISTGTCKSHWDASPASPQCHRGIFRNTERKTFRIMHIYMTMTRQIRKLIFTAFKILRVTKDRTYQLHTAKTHWRSQKPQQWWGAGWQSNRRTSSRSSSHNAAWRAGRWESQWCSWKLQRQKNKQTCYDETSNTEASKTF